MTIQWQENELNVRTRNEKHLTILICSWYNSNYTFNYCNVDGNYISSLVAGYYNHAKWIYVLEYMSWFPWGAILEMELDHTIWILSFMRWKQAVSKLDEPI